MLKRLTMIWACTLAVFVMTVGVVHARDLAEPQKIAVYFYADWCANCKVLSPKLEEVKTENDLLKSETLFVKMDLTDKARIHQSILLAQALGIGDFLKQQGSATGYVAVLDAKSHEEVARIDSASTQEEIKAALMSSE